MSLGLSGSHRRIRLSALLGMYLVAGACAGADVPVADGADVDRPAAATMNTVRFEDVAADIGIDFRHGAFRWEAGPDPAAMMGGGLCWIDYDRDGWLDLYVVNTWSNGEWGKWRSEAGELPASRLYRNDRGNFEDVTADVGARVETRGTGCVAADLDGDGWTDLYITTERDNVLLWNDDGNRFVDDVSLEVPSGAAAFGWHGGAAVGDVDGNGWPDLFVAGYVDLNRPIPSATQGFPNTFEPEPDLLFLNDGPVEDGRVAFREIASAVGLEPDGADYGLGAVFTDLDLDGDLDLFVSHDTTPNQLYENRLADDGQFVEQGVQAGVGHEGAGMGVAAGDSDGDGLPELVTTNELDERHVVFRNMGGSGLRFTDALEQSSVADFGVGSTGWGASWIDVDLDGDLDLMTASGAIPIRDLAADREASLLLENIGEGFVDASETVGLDAVGPRLGRGLAAADFDNDGDMDVALGTIGGQLTLLRNSGAGGTWLEVGTPTPTPGLVVTVELDDGTLLRRELLVGSSYLSSEDPRVHFGLGGADRAALVTVTWPGGDVKKYDDVEADQLLIVEQDD
jgi:hypothetical protein